MFEVAHFERFLFIIRKTTIGNYEINYEKTQPGKKLAYFTVRCERFLAFLLNANVPAEKKSLLQYTN